MLSEERKKKLSELAARHRAKDEAKIILMLQEAGLTPTPTLVEALLTRCKEEHISDLFALAEQLKKERSN